MIKNCLALILVALAAAASAAPAQAGTRAGALQRYAVQYGDYQGWIPTDQARSGGNNRHALYKLTYLANPAPGAEHCFTAQVEVDMPGCPAKWYTGGIELSMEVEAEVTKCGPGWFVVSTPLDPSACPQTVTLPRWAGYPHPR